MSWGKLRKSANTRRPRTKASTASNAKAEESCEESMMLTTRFGRTTAATPEPTAATPATVATLVSNQRFMSMVEAIMPPSPYPRPVNAEPMQSPT